MKTKVRIIKTNDGYYRHLYLQFLSNRWEGSDWLEPFFDISFQCDPESAKWYACNFRLDTDRTDKIAYALKVAKYLDKHLSYMERTPENILKTLNAELYAYTMSEYLPITMDGCNMYHYIIDGSVWCRIFANDFANACLIADKKRDMQSLREHGTSFDVTMVKENIPVVAESTECPYKPKITVE